MDKELYIKQLRPYLYLMDEAHEATGSKKQEAMQNLSAKWKEF